ncbi:MAG: Ppx/GppA family phosphatase, partial [Proteobacteria bacterium]|nr:Ppx/GppA family phosphatase [Pseudomonadota bacterium]
MRLAAIDIGTNTIRLLVADILPDGTVHPVLERQELPRLGKMVDRERRLLPDAMQRTVRILDQFVETARAAGAKDILACGTSALRDAANRDDFVRLVLDRTGISIRVLSGAEEAERTYAG